MGTILTRKLSKTSKNLQLMIANKNTFGSAHTQKHNLFNDKLYETKYILTNLYETKYIFLKVKINEKNLNGEKPHLFEIFPGNFKM